MTISVVVEEAGEGVLVDESGPEATEYQGKGFGGGGGFGGQGIMGNGLQEVILLEIISQ